MIKTIFFDFDGVILDSVNVKTVAFREMYLEFGEEIARNVVVHHLANGGVSRFEKFRIYHQEFLGIKLSEQDINRLANIFSGIVFNKVISSKPISGAIEFIKNSSYYVMYVVSGTPDNEIKAIVESVGLSSYFKGSYGSPEKKYAHVKKIMGIDRLNPNECVFIGDALADYEAAQKNSIHFILVENDDNRRLFDNINTIIRINDLTKLSEIIQGIA